MTHVPGGAVLCNARGVHDAGTGEPALSLILASPRGFRPALADRTVLLLGYGAIAAAVENRLTPFECEVLRVARIARTTARGPVHALVDLPELLPRADIVVITVPLTQDTRGLIDAGLLAQSAGPRRHPAAGEHRAGPRALIWNRSQDLTGRRSG